MPQYFRGISKEYGTVTTISIFLKRTLGTHFAPILVGFPQKNKSGNPLKQPPTPETVSKLRSLMKFDFEFYRFIQQRFHKLYNFVMTWRHTSSDYKTTII